MVPSLLSRALATALVMLGFSATAQGATYRVHVDVADTRLRNDKRLERSITRVSPNLLAVDFSKDTEGRVTEILDGKEYGAYRLSVYSTRLREGLVLVYLDLQQRHSGGRWRPAGTSSIAFREGAPFVSGAVIPLLQPDASSPVLEFPEFLVTLETAVP